MYINKLQYDALSTFDRERKKNYTNRFAAMEKSFDSFFWHSLNNVLLVQFYILKIIHMKNKIKEKRERQMMMMMIMMGAHRSILSIL